MAALGVSQVLIAFCGETGELERDRDCKKTFSDVLRSVFMRRALSDGESKLLFGCFKLELLIKWFFFRELLFHDETSNLVVPTDKRKLFQLNDE